MACICPSGGPQPAPHLRHLRLQSLQVHLVLPCRLVRLLRLRRAAMAPRGQRLANGGAAVELVPDLAVLVHHARLHMRSVCVCVCCCCACVCAVLLCVRVCEPLLCVCARACACTVV